MGRRKLARSSRWGWFIFGSDGRHLDEPCSDFFFTFPRKLEGGRERAKEMWKELWELRLGGRGTAALGQDTMGSLPKKLKVRCVPRRPYVYAPSVDGLICLFNIFSFFFFLLLDPSALRVMTWPFSARDWRKSRGRRHAARGTLRGTTSHPLVSIFIAWRYTWSLWSLLDVTSMRVITSFVACHQVSVEWRHVVVAWHG